MTENGVINSGKTVAYGQTGVFFPAGCFMDIDVHCTGGVVVFAKESA